MAAAPAAKFELFFVAPFSNNVSLRAHDTCFATRERFVRYLSFRRDLCAGFVNIFQVGRQSHVTDGLTCECMPGSINQ
jgi:hypothetical protein